MTAKIPRKVVHHGLNDPRTSTGGVETFARSLQRVFEQVVFSTPDSLDLQTVRRERLPVICDNHHVLDFPEPTPVIGFQHGVSLDKLRSTRDRTTLKLAWRQFRASKRSNTLWIACAQWMSDRFEELHGNRARHIIYHAVDLSRFDGELDNRGSRLILHDARTPHKGSGLIAALSKRFSDWRFEPLNCAPEAVPDRMRKARAFIHLSRYEGNSMVCNEAMAMNLPCLFTRVGLFRDPAQHFDVGLIDAKVAFTDSAELHRRVASFLGDLDRRAPNPRAWVLEHATQDRNVASWQAAMEDFDGIRAS